MIDEYKCKECSLGWWPNKNLTGNVLFFTALCMLLLDYLAPGGGCEVLFSPGLSVCLCVCVSVCLCVRPIFIGQRSRSHGRYIAF